MTTKKAGSLTFPSNPLAAMQELSALDAPIPSPAPEKENLEKENLPGSHVSDPPKMNTITVPEMNTTTLPRVQEIALPVANTTTLPESSTTRSERSVTPDRAERRRTGPKPTKQRGSAVSQTTSSAEGSATSSLVVSGTDPVRQAMLGMLAQPYPAGMDEGVMTVTSVKIPKPIWERLEYARTITKKDKQDIIAEALRLYFDQIVK